MTDTATQGGQKLPLSTVLDIVREVEEEVLDENKHGATRDMIAEGTCERIRWMIREAAENNSKPDGDA